MCGAGLGCVGALWVRRGWVAFKLDDEDIAVVRMRWDRLRASRSEVHVGIDMTKNRRELLAERSNTRPHLIV